MGSAATSAAGAVSAAGAGAAGALMVVSTSSSVPLEKIAAAATGPLWFQLYTGPDKETTRERVENAVHGEGKCQSAILEIR